MRKLVVKKIQGSLDNGKEWFPLVWKEPIEYREEVENKTFSFNSFEELSAFVDSEDNSEELNTFKGLSKYQSFFTKKEIVVLRNVSLLDGEIKITKRNFKNNQLLIREQWYLVEGATMQFLEKTLKAEQFCQFLKDHEISYIRG